MPDAVLAIDQGTTGCTALVLRGDHELNAIKAEKHPAVATPLAFAGDTQIREAAGCAAGSLGPVDLAVPVIVDQAASQLADFVCGANTDGVHLTGVNWGRDLGEPPAVDIRNVVDRWDRAGWVRLVKPGMAPVELCRFMTAYGGAIEHEVDYIAASFVQSADDLERIAGAYRPS